MKTHQMLIILFICLVVSSSCGEESEKYEPVIQKGDIHGKLLIVMWTNQ